MEGAELAERRAQFCVRIDFDAIFSCTKWKYVSKKIFVEIADGSRRTPNWLKFAAKTNRLHESKYAESTGVEAWRRWFFCISMNDDAILHK